MDATIRRHEGVDENRAVGTYADERTARRRRNRAVGFFACIALWLLSAVPLVRLSSEDGGGTAVAAVYLATGFGLAVLVRLIYALLTRRAFLSPWLFVTAALLAITSYGVLSAGERTTTPGSRDAAEMTRPSENAFLA